MAPAGWGGNAGRSPPCPGRARARTCLAEPLGSSPRGWPRGCAAARGEGSVEEVARGARSSQGIRCSRLNQGPRFSAASGALSSSSSSSSSSVGSDGASSGGSPVSPLPGLLSGVRTESLSRDDCVWLSQERKADWLRSCWLCPRGTDSSRTPLTGGGLGPQCCDSSSLLFRGRPRQREAVQFIRLGMGTSTGSSFTGETWGDAFSSGGSWGAGSATARAGGGGETRAPLLARCPPGSPFPAHRLHPPRRCRPGGAGPSTAAGTGPGPEKPLAASVRNGAASCGRTSASVGRTQGGDGPRSTGPNPQPPAARSPWPASRSASRAQGRWTPTCQPGEGTGPVREARVGREETPEGGVPTSVPPRAADPTATPPPPPCGFSVRGSPPPPPSPGLSPPSGGSCAGAARPPGL